MHRQRQLERRTERRKTQLAATDPLNHLEPSQPALMNLVRPATGAHLSALSEEPDQVFALRGQRTIRGRGRRALGFHSAAGFVVGVALCSLGLNGCRLLATRRAGMS